MNRFCYVISKDGESFQGYLFPDNVEYWRRKGYTLTLSNIQKG